MLNEGKRKRVGVLISGRGSNMNALIEAARDPAYPAEIALVLSNIASAAGLDRAASEGIAAEIVDHKAFVSREAFERALDDALNVHGIEIVCLAGFMRILTPWFISRWEGRLLNIHPSLLPAFKGLHTHAAALAAGVRLHGCTVHFVTPDLDSGPIIAQAAVPVLGHDDEAALGKRVLAQEHRIYPAVLAALAKGEVELVEGRAVSRAPRHIHGEALVVAG